MAILEGTKGGALAALTTSEVAVDLSVFANRTVMISCDDGDIYYAFSDATGTLITAAPQTASLTALVGRRIRKGRSIPRVVVVGKTIMVAKMVTGTGTLRVVPVGDVGNHFGTCEETVAGDSTATVTGTVTSTDAAGQEWTLGTQGALAASFVVLAAAGTFRSAFGRIDKTAPSGDYFVQLFNATTATGTPVAKGVITHTTGVHSPWTLSGMEKGVRHTTGIAIGLSSTEDTFTGAGSYLKVGGAEYKA